MNTQPEPVELSAVEYTILDGFSQTINAHCMPLFDILAWTDPRIAARAYKYLSKMIDNANSAVDAIETICSYDYKKLQ